MKPNNSPRGSRKGNKILLVEDDAALRQTVSDLLSAQGYKVETAANGRSGLDIAGSGDFHLIILDIMLPGMNGFDVCRHLRRQGIETPILMLTARSELNNKLIGFKAGADDYLTKPFDGPELQVRVQALLRRVPPPATELKSCEFGGITVDFTNSSLMRNGQRVMLSGRESRLLQYLVERRGEIVSREELLREVWGYNALSSTRTVDVHIVSLRQKIGDDFREPKYILTVYSEGYRFVG